MLRAGARGVGRSMSSVSVVMPCYKYGHYLEAAVRSVLEDQDGVDVRVLIIDDASPDDSAEVARAIARRERRVEVLVHETNKGNIATFNEGLLEWADGDYCLLLSADDRVTPGALRRACDLLDAHPEVGFAYGHALWTVEGQPEPTPRTTPRGWSVVSGQRWLDHRFRQAENPIICPEVVVRTSVHHRVGGYDPRLPKAADMELLLRLAAHADVGFLRGVDQAFYRVHNQSMSKSVSPLADLKQRRGVFLTALEQYPERMSDPQRLSDVVHRQLAREALWAAGRSDERLALSRSRFGRRVLGATPADDRDAVDELVAFAEECWPEVKRSPMHRALASGAPLGPRELGFLLTEKARWWGRRRSWRYRGF